MFKSSSSEKHSFQCTFLSILNIFFYQKDTYFRFWRTYIAYADYIICIDPYYCALFLFLSLSSLSLLMQLFFRIYLYVTHIFINSS